MTGYEDDRYLSAKLRNFFLQGQTIQAGHAHIQNKAGELAQLVLSQKIKG